MCPADVKNGQKKFNQFMVLQFRSSANDDCRRRYCVARLSAAFPSIEQFEAAGEGYWDAYFKAMLYRVKSGRSADLQIITFRFGRALPEDVALLFDLLACQF